MQFLFNNRKIASDDQDRDPSSRSDHTLTNGTNAQDENSNEENHEKADNGESGEDGPRAPVGFWHPSLKKTRLNVFGAWARTGKLLSFLAPICTIGKLMSYSTYSINLYSRDPLPVLGCTVQCRTKFELPHRIRGQFRNRTRRTCRTTHNEID